MKCSDYIAQFLAEHDANHVFLVTGGAIAHVVDSIGSRAQEKGDIGFTCVVHEQSAAIAVESFSKLSGGRIGVAMATSGPGATNLITGMCGCWFDSVPGIFITGQVSTKEAVAATEVKPRQVGFQETDIYEIAKPFTKFAVVVTDPKNIRRALEEALYHARTGRPGPVLIDIPVDVQTADVDPKKLKGFVAPKRKSSPAALARKAALAVKMLKAAKRPVLIFGGGVRTSAAENEALALSKRIGSPLVVSWSAFDVVPEDFPNYCGPLGVYGSRGANLAVQNADLIFAIGSRLDTRQTGGKLSSFAREAKRIMVDIDPNEIRKGRGLSIDLGIVSDAKEFITALTHQLGTEELPTWNEWKRHVNTWKAKYRFSEQLEDRKDEPMNAYPFLRSLSDELRENEIIIANEGGNLVWTMQSFRIKKGQRLISSFGNSPMGYAFPASIGAALGLKDTRIICIEGDGGFQLNIQELQTVKYYNLPVKIFVINNKCMGIIKQFQDQYFGSRYFASSPEHGYEAPDFVKIAEAYGIPAMRVSKLSEATSSIRKALDMPGPVLVDVLVDVEQKLSPKLEFGRPLEDMSPYLPREELQETMLLELLPESKELPKKRGWVNL